LNPPAYLAVKNKAGLKGNVAQSLPEGKNSKITLLPVSLSQEGGDQFLN